VTAASALRWLDDFARRQKRYWVTEVRHWIKRMRHEGARTAERRWADASRAMARWGRKVARETELRRPKLLKPLKISMEHLRNVPAIVRNLTRKALLYAWGLRRPVVRWRVRRQRLGEKWASLSAESAIVRDIEKITERGDPLIVGPWMSEVGYEALYWIPFVRWVQSHFQIKSDQMLVLSRGGAGSWYADITPHHLEVFDYVTPEAFAAYNAKRMASPSGSIKQFDVSEVERDLVERARAEWGVPRAQMLHPSLMYRLFQQFWAGNRALSFLDEHAHYRPLEAPPAGVTTVRELPEDYVAMKFYTAQSLQNTPHTRALLRELIAGIAERHPVVLLDTGLTLDDHDDYDLALGDRVVSARHWMDARSNLATQARIIAGARAFVGTCGGMAWLAPMLGVDTTAVMTDDKFLNVHLQVAHRVGRVLNRGRFIPLDLGGLDVLGLTIGRPSMERGE
jgi:hypothetical protein